MHITELQGDPTRREVASFVDAYSEYPWRESNSPDEIEVYLKQFRSDQATALAFALNPGTAPYMYAHYALRSGSEAIEELVQEEFDSDEAFYRAKNPEPIVDRLTRLGSFVFLYNVNADRMMPRDRSTTRLGELYPVIIEKSMADMGVDSLALFTHPRTQVYRQSEVLAGVSDYQVDILDYQIEPVEHNDARSLALIAISR